MRGASSIGRGPWRCLLAPPIHSFPHESGIRDRGRVLLRHVELALLLKTRANVSLTQGLELGPVLAELLRETPLRQWSRT
jgi:hypothetical protein